MKAVLRNLQAHTPWVRPLKFGLYNFLTQHFGWRIDPDLLVLKLLPHVRLAIDIGGNWGQSVEAIRRLRPEASLITIEPNPMLAQRLQRIYPRDPRIKVHNCGLSSSRGMMRLHVPRYRHFVYDGLASLDYEEAAGWLNNETVWHFNPAHLSIDSFDVNVITLDDFGLLPDFIKIDVQGHELEVLRGAKNTLRRRPVIMLEGADSLIVEFLRDFDILPFSYADGRFVQDKIDGVNTIFMTAEQALLCRSLIRNYNE